MQIEMNRNHLLNLIKITTEEVQLIIKKYSKNIKIVVNITTK